MFYVYPFRPVRRIGRWMVPRVEDNNPKWSFHWISKKNRLVRAAEETWKFPNCFNYSRRRYVAEILPIMRKILSNQSINHSLLVLKDDKENVNRYSL